MKRVPVTALVLGVLLTIMGVASAQSPEVVTELDPGIGVHFDLTKKTKLDFFFGREKSEEISSDKWKASGGLSFRVKSLYANVIDDADRDKLHALVVGASYEYSWASKSGSVTRENRLTLAATPRYVFPWQSKLLLSDRNLFEFRWVNGAYRFRYRNRLRLERGFKPRKYKFTPYVSAEAYWDQHYDKWSQFRFAGGVQLPITKRTALDTYYERQHCVTCSDPQTNIFGLTLNVYLDRKK